MKIALRIVLAVLLLIGLFFTTRYFSTEAKLNRLTEKYEKVLEEYADLAEEFDSFVTEKQIELDQLKEDSDRLERDYYFNKGSLTRLRKESIANKERAQDLEKALEHIRSAKELNIKRKLTNEELDLYFINLFDTIR